MSGNQHNDVLIEQMKAEIDRLRVTLTATENALREIGNINDWHSYSPETRSVLTPLLTTVVSRVDAEGNAVEGATGIIVGPDILAAARVVVSADPPEEGT